MLGIHQNVKRQQEKKYVRGYLFLIFIGLFEEEVGSKLLVLVTGEIGLDDRVPREAKTTKLRKVSYL